MKPVYYSTPDHELEIAQKLQLIKGIEYWQAERWERIKKWRRLDLPINVRHIFVRNEIDLIRQEARRLLKLKQEVLQ